MNSMVNDATPVRYGATREDWLSLSFLADLTADLLPYVADPGVQPVPPYEDGTKRTTWYPGAKMPGLVDSNGYGHGIKDWQKKRSTERDVDRWAGDPRLGICIATRRVRAIDVDVQDAAQAAAIEHLILSHFGVLPTRRRVNSTKFLCAVMVEVDHPLPKKIARTEHGIVELLTDLQQFFAVGVHTSGERYTWDRGTPSEFPRVSLATLELFWRELEIRFATEASVEFAVGKQLARARTYEDIDDPVVQFLEAEGWVKDTGRDGKVYIRCPFESGHSKVDTDHTATVYFPRGVGGLEQGHFKCQHASCAARNDGDFLNAVGFGVDEFPVVEVSEEQAAAEAVVPSFRRTESTGKILPNISNLMLALRAPQWLGVDIAQDEFRDELMITPTGRRQWRQFTDADYTRVRLVLASAGIEVGLELVKEGVTLRADENRFDSAILWLREEVPEWDGVPRIDSFYPGYFGTEDTPYTRAVGAYTWTALAARVLDPGHKVDMAPILCSGEGCRKSESIAAMVPDRDFFAEIDLGLKDDDLSRLMRGRLIAELGEMRGLRKREMGHLKAFITRRFENWVPKYKEFAVKFPRRLLFIGTTNETHFLSEQTGQRRWLPMNISRADTDAIERDRLQLWAEGRERFLRNGVAFSEAEDLAKDEHGKFEEAHPWEAVIEKWLALEVDFEKGVTNRERLFSTEDVLVSALNVPVARLTKHERNEVGACLRKLGFVMRQVRDGDRRKWVWASPVTELE